MCDLNFSVLMEQGLTIDKNCDYLKSKLLEPSKLGYSSNGRRAISRLNEEAQSIQTFLNDATEELRTSNDNLKKCIVSVERLINDISSSVNDFYSYGIENGAINAADPSTFSSSSDDHESYAYGSNGHTEPQPQMRRRLNLLSAECSTPLNSNPRLQMQFTPNF